MKEELKILMLEDLEEDTGLIVRTLKKENFRFTHVRVETREEFFESCHSYKPDLILSDHSLPQFNSIEALKICHEAGLKVPFILVTGAVSEEFAVMCLKQGADDYVLKSNLSRLPIAIRAAFENRQRDTMRITQEEKLHKQNEELMKINKELDSFVYSVSHNLRSPLSSILGLINVARMEQRDKLIAPDQYFDLMEKSVLKLDDTIKEILDYSKNSRNEIVATTIDFNILVQEAFNQLKYLNGYDSIRKEITVDGELLFYSDAFRLKVILTNLISNALKYCDPIKDQSFIKITISITPDAAIIQIEDNGIGIHSRLLPNIYKMFYRATEKNEGSGLGLYIVKEMIDKLEGEISISSIYSQGTTITISLPNMEIKQT